MTREAQPPTMHTKLVAASVSDMVQEWYQGKCDVPPMQADLFERRISRFQPDLTPPAAENATLRASEAAALERVKVLETALKFYRGAWSFKTNKRYGGLEWFPSEKLLDDCGNVAKSALTPTADKEPKT